MSLNTEHKVTLTEAQISVILNSLDYTDTFEVTFRVPLEEDN